MTITFNSLENKLKDFIIEAQSDAYNRRSINVTRYNNLKITMDSSRIQVPHIIVRIGISEACFDLNNNIVIQGSLGYENKLVIKWINRTGIRNELVEAFKAYQNFDLEEIIREIKEE